MKHFIFLTSIIIGLCFTLSCLKDEVDTQKEEIISNIEITVVNSDSIQTELKTTPKLVFYLESCTADNYLYAYGIVYNNEQYLFNKDSIFSIFFFRLSSEIVTINQKPHTTFAITITFKDKTAAYITGYAVDDPDPRKRKQTYTYYPSGQNYGAGINKYVRYIRNAQTLRYYDFTFNKWKTKNLYTLIDKDNKVLYSDYIPSLLEKSNWFVLPHKS